jgi:RimJ/RimL family protein N-acetyltransferase
METDFLLLHYRLAATNDFDTVYELYMNEHSNQFLTYDPMEKDDFKLIYNELLPTNTLFVAELNDEVIGTYRLIRKTHRQADTVYLGGFTIKSSHKGQGLGTGILNHIKEEAASLGIKRIELTVDIQNEAAINLYEKTGFEKEGYIRKSYKLQSTGEYYDEYLMALIL